VQIYFVRHGQSEANALRVISNRGWVHPLTELGRQQARELADRLDGRNLLAIYTSPLRRAVETSEILSASLGLAYQVSDGLREYDCGVLEGRGDEGAWQCFMETWHQWEAGNQAYRPDGGESFQDIQARFLPFIRGLITDYGDLSGGMILVGHGGLFRHMLPLVVVNLPPAELHALPFGNTHYLLTETSPEGLKCVEYGGDNVQWLSS
jgi:broad specificity phosphatase PhoE